MDSNNDDASEMNNQKILNRALNSLENPIYIIDVKNFEVIYGNKISGWSQNKKMTCHELSHGLSEPCNDSNHFCSLKTVCETGRPQLALHTHKDKEGNDQLVEVKSTPIFNINGKVEFIIERVFDQTFEIKAKNQLFENAKFMDQIVEAIPDAVIVLNSGIIELANIKFRKLAEGKSLTGKNIKEIAGSEVLSTISNLLDSSDKIGTVKTEQGKLFKIRKNKIIGLYQGMLEVVSLTDITDEQKIKESSLEQHQVAKLAFDNATDAILWIDLFTKEVVNCNKAALKLFEMDTEELLQLELVDIFPEKFRSGHSEKIGSIFDKGAGEGEFQVITSSGDLKETIITVSVIVLQGKMIASCSIKELTEMKKIILEKEVLQSKMYITSKLASIGELASGIGHEINNPLTVLKGNNKLIKKYLQKDSKESMDKVLDIIQVQHEMLERVTEIVKGLRVYSHMDDDNQSSRVNVRDGITQTILMIKTIFLKQGISIELDFSDERLVFNGNDGYFNQIILNLLTNARDGILDRNIDDGKIIVSAKTVDKSIIVKVKDNGTGIPKDIIKNIFESFYTTKAKDKGTGLGLSIVSSLMEKMKGKITVENNTDHGAQFTLSFLDKR